MQWTLNRVFTIIRSQYTKFSQFLQKLAKNSQILQCKKNNQTDIERRGPPASFPKFSEGLPFFTDYYE